MIEYYQNVGLRMYRVRYFLILLIVAFSVVTLSLIFVDQDISGRFLLPAMVLTTWLILSLSFAYYFAGLNLDIQQDAGWLERIGYSIRKAVSYFLALLFTCLSLALLYFTTTAIRVAMST